MSWEEDRARRDRRAMVRGCWLIALLLLSFASWTVGGVWVGWYYPKTYEYALRLADDASLPEVKAKYLREYRDCIAPIYGKPRYIFMRPDLELDNQREILNGLIKRLDDVAAIPPSDMAYQQGMMQLTGQEVDHQLGRISGIFCAARYRQNFLLFLFVSVGGFVFPLVILVLVICLASEL